jgi:hypothetical protein
MEQEILTLGLKIEALRSCYVTRQYLPLVAFEDFFTPEIPFQQYKEILKREDLIFRLWFVGKMIEYYNSLSLSERYDNVQFYKNLMNLYADIYSFYKTITKERKQKNILKEIKKWYNWTLNIISKYVIKMRRIKDFTQKKIQKEK